MAWSTPEVREVCVGMEVTSYLSRSCDYRTPPVSKRAASPDLQADKRRSAHHVWQHYLKAWSTDTKHHGNHRLGITSKNRTM
jgi:coenzyme PQQ precursor peptide PqqA